MACSPGKVQEIIDRIIELSENNEHQAEYRERVARDLEIEQLKALKKKYPEAA